MKKYFKQLIAVLGSMALSIAILTAMTANAASAGQLIAGLTNPDGSPYTEPLTNPDGSPYEEEETYPPTECVDPYYLYDVVMCQPAIDATATTTYSLSFLPDDGDYNTVTIPNLPGSEYPYEFKVHRSMWLIPADDWIGDENGNNIGFYKRTDGAVTIGYDESTDHIWVSGEGVEMVQVYHSLPDNSYNPTHPATYPTDSTNPTDVIADPEYLYSVIMCQPSVSMTETTTYSFSFLPGAGGNYTLTLNDFGGSEGNYEFKIYRSGWLRPAGDWIGDENGNNIAFAAPQKGDVTITFNENTEQITVEGQYVQMKQSYLSLPDNSYNPTHPATYPVDTTAPVEELTTSPAATEPVTVLKKGDADGNGSVTIADATTVQMAAAELISLSDAQRTAADVNKDGTVDVRDATMIQQFLVELVPGFD